MFISLEAVFLSQCILLFQKPDCKEISLLTSKVLDEFISVTPAPVSVVPWSPPVANWNPWTGCNIDEGPLAQVSF